MTAERRALSDTFISASGWGDAAREFLAGDASNRTYERLIDLDTNRSAILMDAPPEKGEDVRPFVQVAQALLAQGFSAPKIYHSDAENGFLLIEDLGDALFAQVCAGNPDAEEMLYSAAIDLLAQSHKTPAEPWLLPYDTSVYLREALLLVEWYLPAVTGHPVSKRLMDDYRDLIQAACGTLDVASPVMVQRDYHAENLLWLPDREGVSRVGLLDFQDALAGHRAYDLVSLLEDARRDTSIDLQTTMFDRYVSTSGIATPTFRRDYSILGAQRNLKILGIFARLCVRDGKWSYVDLMPRVWDHLMRDVQDPALADLRTWIEVNVPQPDTSCQARLKDLARA